MYDRFLEFSGLRNRYKWLAALFGVAFGLAGNGLLAQQAAPNPYTLRFEDFEWEPSGKLVEIAGAMPLRGPNPTRESLLVFKERVQRNPHDVASRVVLGELYLRLAKEEDDLAAYAQSEVVLREAIELSSGAWAAQVALANTLLATHQFAEALEVSERVLLKKPRHAAGLAARFDSLLELGRYDEAGNALEGLLVVEESPPVWARQARLAELSGDSAGALEIIERCVRAEPDNAWYHWRKGQLYFAQGKLQQAKACFEGALSLKADDVASLVGLAQCAFAMNDPRTTLQKLTLALENGGGPPVMSLLGDYYARQAAPVQADSWYDKADDGMREEAKIAGDAHARERAMFLADHARDLDKALELARNDLKRRQDIYAFDTLAWVSHRLGQHRDAAENMKKAISLETRDPLLLYHASIIFESADEPGMAEEQRAKLVATNPNFSILFGEQLFVSGESQPLRAEPIQNGTK